MFAKSKPMKKSPTRIVSILLAVAIAINIYFWYRWQHTSQALAVFANDIHSTASCKEAAKIVNSFLDQVQPLIGTSKTRASIVWGS